MMATQTMPLRRKIAPQSHVRTIYPIRVNIFCHDYDWAAGLVDVAFVKACKMKVLKCIRVKDSGSYWEGEVTIGDNTSYWAIFHRLPTMSIRGIKGEFAYVRKDDEISEDIFDFIYQNHREVTIL